VKVSPSTIAKGFFRSYLEGFWIGLKALPDINRLGARLCQTPNLVDLQREMNIRSANLDAQSKPLILDLHAPESEPREYQCYVPSAWPCDRSK
jgi:hypothetical protein